MSLTFAAFLYPFLVFPGSKFFHCVLCVFYNCQFAMHLCGVVLALDRLRFLSFLFLSMMEVSDLCSAVFNDTNKLRLANCENFRFLFVVADRVALNCFFFITSASSGVFAVAKTLSVFLSQIEIIAPLSSGFLM